MKKNRRIVSLLAGAAVIISMITPLSKGYAEERTGTYDLKTVNISNVRAQDDFYEAVNGEWTKNEANNINDLYGEKSTYSDIKENNDKIVKSEFESFLHNKNKYGENSDERKMADVYENYINREARNSQGIEPMEKYLSKIDSVNTMDDLAKLLGDSEIDILTNLIDFNIKENYNGSAYEIAIDPTELSLVDSGKYGSNGDYEYYSKVRDFYMSLLSKCGYSEVDSKKMIDDLFKFENSISGSILSYDTDESQIDKSQYNILMKIEDLDREAPNIKLSSMMKSLKIDNANYIEVSEVNWLKKLNELWTQENLPLIKNYIELNVIRSSGRYLSEDMDKLYYNFIENILGVKFSDVSIQSEAYSKISSVFPISLGKLYTEKTFNEAEKADVQNIADKVMNVYKEKIKSCSWISDVTRENLMDKLNKMKINIGYSNSNQDYSNAEIKLYSQGGSLLENMINIALTARDNQIKTLNTPINKNEIIDQIIPQDVVAEYHTLNNTVVITPGIIQPELYDINDSTEEKLAGIGIVIAHEIGHSLDILGAFFDGEGNVKDIWTKEDFNKYKEKALYIMNYYSEIEALPGKYIDGELTLCENMADIQGMSCILELLKNTKYADYKLFFESYAKAYKSIKTKESYEQALVDDEHSPDKERVNVVLSQFQKFYDTYGISSDDKMYVNPEDRMSPLW